MRAFAVVASVFTFGAIAASAHAQTWSSPRGRPALWQIVSVDATGEDGWPYDREDVAGDGLTTFEADEAGIDLRTVYADADADRLWLRAYVASESAPPSSLVAFFFLDTDDRAATGGDADAAALFPDFGDAAAPGGYERAIAVRGDGSLLGAFRWNDQSSQWAMVPEQPNEIGVELDVDADPVRLGALEHGYVQIDVVHAVSGLDTSCDGSILVRLWNDDAPARAFGDDDDEATACRVPLDALGDPVVLRSAACTDDADCPADGECRDGVCLFTYECSGDADCPSGESCTAGACVRVVDRSCSDDGDCDGLVCESGNCVACTDSGARACGAGLVCSPNGSCVDTGAPSAGTGGSGRAGTGGTGAAGAGGEAAFAGTTQGGAFNCAATRARAGQAVPSPLLLLFGLLVLRRVREPHRRAGRRARGARAGTRSP